MNIITRLLVSFGGLILFYNLALWGFFSGFTERSSGMLQQSERTIQAVDQSRAAWDAFRDVRDYTSGVLAMIQPLNSSEVDQEFKRLYRTFSERLALVESLSSGQPQLAATAAEARTLAEGWKQQMLSRLSASNSTALPSAIATADRGTQLEAAINTLVADTVAGARVLATSTQQEMDETGRNTALMAIAFAIAAVGFSGFLAWTISKPIRRLSARMSALAGGDSGTRVPYADKNDEIGEMARALRVFRDAAQARDELEHSIDDAVKSLRSNADNLTSIAAQTRSGLQQQKKTVDEVNNHISETVSELNAVGEQTTGLLEQSRDAAEKTTGIGADVKASSTAVNDSVQQMGMVVETISRLKDDSVKVGEVLQVISGIAEQTNLLALNAAIEAARAGEHGRGFSVVADEVRSLANMTQESAQKIQSMIQNIQGGTQSAVDAISRSQELTHRNQEAMTNVSAALGEVHEAVVSVSEMNERTAEKTRQQLVRMDDVSRNISGLNEASRAALQDADRLSEVSGALDSLSRHLTDLMARHG
ncbi:methyl-accepting chemotaxis protein [Thalassolituus sp.]|uniref:methyl-accepting chemotaxis protein n=1 Tax=Thalassolituus sp. TaxID=2030822 RepID=UPI00351171B9